MLLRWSIRSCTRWSYIIYPLRWSLEAVQFVVWSLESDEGFDIFLVVIVINITITNVTFSTSSSFSFYYYYFCYYCDFFFMANRCFH